MQGSLALVGSSLAADDIARFWSKVNVKQYGCWEWCGAAQPKGYGTFRLNGKTELAHRVAFSLFYDEAPADSSIRHKCDNPSCCRPAHMEVGTNADNVADRVERGRNRTARGKSHPRNVLDERQVREIRARLALGHKHREIALDYGVTSGAISGIKSGAAWGHLE